MLGEVLINSGYPVISSHLLMDIGSTLGRFFGLKTSRNVFTTSHRTTAKKFRSGVDEFDQEYLQCNECKTRWYQKNISYLNLHGCPKCNLKK